MITEYLSKIIQFKNITVEKYEDCLTRQEFIEKVREKVRLMGPEIIVPESEIDPDYELFCGDQIIGIWEKGDVRKVCFYTWKRNNPTEIVAFSRLEKFKREEQVGDIEFISPDTKPGKTEKYQIRVDEWMQVCFGEKISKDKVERNHRFLEEALELVQSVGCTKSEAHQLVDYVFTRPQGDPQQECGGVMVTLAALCLANNLDMDNCGEVELKRIWTKVDQIREKQAAKPKHSPLPE